MTKTHEIALLDKFIAQLGDDSYLGPWLASNRAEIVRDMTSDLEPTVLLPSAARTIAQTTLQQAKAEAAVIIASARKVAEQDIQRANNTVREVCSDARRTLEKMAARL